MNLLPTLVGSLVGPMRCGVPKLSSLEQLKAQLEGTAQVSVEDISKNSNTENQDSEKYYLEFSSTSEKGKLVELNQKLKIGREVGDFLINHPSISNNHCTFFLNQNVLSVVDNGSKNSTKIAGKKIKPGQMFILEEGDVVSVGQVELKVILKSPEKVKSSLISDGVSKVGMGKTAIEKLKSLFGPKRGRLELAVSSDTKVQQGVLGKLKTLIKPPRWFKEFSLMGLFKKKAVAEEEGNTAPAPKKMERPKLVPVPPASKGVGKIKNQYSYAGVFIRMLALLGDVVLVLLICSWAQSSEEGKSFLDSISSLGPKYLAPYLKKFDVLEFAEDVNAILPYIAIYVANTFVSVALFGVTFSQFILGIRARGPVVWARLGGMIRETLGFITVPTLVLEATCIFGWRTIKEMVTFTGLIYERNWVKVFMAALYTLIIIPTYFFYPILKDLNLLQGMELHVAKIKKIVPKASDFGFNSAASVSMQSNLFKLSTQYTLSERFHLIPRFEIVKKGKTVSYTPVLIVYDAQRDVKGEIKVYKTFSFQEILAKSKRLNPVFDSFFPKIAEELMGPAANWQQGHELKNADLATIHKFQTENQKEIKKELEDLIIKSLTMNLADLIQNDPKFIPLTKALATIRESVLKELGLPEKPYIEKITLGNLDFIRFTLEKKSPYLIGQDTYKEYYLPLGVKSGTLIEMSWDLVKQYEVTANQFFAEFFEKAYWVIDLKTPFAVPEASNQNLTVFSYLDYFTSPKVKGDARQQLEDSIYDYFYKISSYAVRENKERLRLYIQGTLKRYNNIMELALAGKNLPKRKEFQDRMNSLYINLRENNRTFFKP